MLSFRTNTGGGVWAFGLVRAVRAKAVKAVSEALRRCGQGQGGVGNGDCGRRGWGGGGSVAHFEG